MDMGLPATQFPGFHKRTEQRLSLRLRYIWSYLAGVLNHSFPRIIPSSFTPLVVSPYLSLDPKNEVYLCPSYCFMPCCFHCFRTTHNQYPVSSWLLSPCFFILIPSNSASAVLCEPLLISWMGGVGTYPIFMLSLLNLISLLQLPTIWYVMIFSTWQ